MTELLKDLNKEQKQAVMHENGPLLIVAGAGTGKTTVITRRIAYLILEKKVRPDRILAMTFTEKAAGEMEERVDKMMPMGYVDLWISTFHSFCEKILQNHALDIGLPSSFKILDQTAQWVMVKENLDKFNLDYYKPLGNPTKFIHALISHFSKCKDEEIYPENYLEYAEKLKLDSDSAFSLKDLEIDSTNKLTKKEIEQLKTQEIKRIEEAANAYHVYQNLLLERDSLDFGDLINYTLKLFKERPIILERYRQQFEYILVDEFQDTNWAQYALIKLLAHPKNNLTVVGDDDQSIYKFRGASISNIMQFKDDFKKSKEIVIAANYRSKQNLLDLSHKFIMQNNPDRLEIKLKINKKLKAHAKDKGVIEHLHGRTLEDEVNLVIKKILDLKKKDKDCSWNDFAILVRANDQANIYNQALKLNNIPYQFLASRGLYYKPVIMDVIAYLKLLDNYHENAQVYRVLNFPFFKFSHEDISKLTQQAYKSGVSIYEILKNPSMVYGLSAETKAEIDKLMSFISKHTSLVKEKTMQELFVEIVKDIGYERHLLKKGNLESEEAIGYLNQFSKKIKDFQERAEDCRLRDFMQALELELEAGDQGALKFDIEAGPDMVRVMTVHGAKGLEFKYVFIVNLVDRRFPTDSRKDQIEIPLALVKEMLPEGDFHIQEERRLFYVGMTRAKNSLFLTSGQDYGGQRRKKISRFLIELEEAGFKLSEEAFSIQHSALSNKQEAEKAEKPKYALPQRFSYSQIAAFTNCPYQYKLGNILKIPIRGKHVFSFGKTMHNTLHKFIQLYRDRLVEKQKDLFGQANPKEKKLKVSLNELYDIYEDNWIDEWYKNKQEKEKYKKMGKESLKIFYNAFEKELPMVIGLEQDFNAKIGNASFYGRIDRIDLLDDKTVRIIDYKTGKSKDAKKLDADDKMQLLIYQIGVQEALNMKPKQLTFYYLNDCKEVNFLGSDDEIKKLKEKIIGIVKQISESDFSAKPKNGKNTCEFCDFKEICEYRTR